jgi:hypothetical protein
MPKYFFEGTASLGGGNGGVVRLKIASSCSQNNIAIVLEQPKNQTRICFFEKDNGEKWNEEWDSRLLKTGLLRPGIERDFISFCTVKWGLK